MFLALLLAILASATWAADPLSAPSAAALASPPSTQRPTPAAPPTSAPSGLKARAPRAIEKTRNWTDVTGKFKTEATLLELKGGKARLKKTDGRTVEVPIAKLSEADREYLKTLESGTKPAELGSQGLPEGTLAYFEFNGDFTDLSGNEVSFSAEKTSFRDGCLHLDGTYELGGGYRASCRTPSIDFARGFTVGLRFKAETFVHTKRNVVTGGRDRWFRLLRDYRKEEGPANLSLWLNNSEFNHQFQNAPLAAGEWVTVFCSVDVAAKKTRVSLNGRLLEEVTLPPGFAFKAPDGVWMFSDFACAAVVQGLIDWLIVIDRPLSSEELRTTGLPLPAEAVKALEVRAKAAEEEGNIEVRLAAREKIMGAERLEDGIVSWYRPTEIVLADKPPVPLKAEPAYRSKNPLYGCLRLGDADDDRVVVAMDEPIKGAPRIYVDRNNDRDLTNDGDGAWSSENGGFLNLRDVVIHVRYRSGIRPYMVNLYRNPDRIADKVLYYRNSAREGEVVLGDSKFKFLVLDENCDGRYDDLQNDMLLVDANEDGKIEPYPDAAMTCARGMASGPFKVGDLTLRTRAISPDGTLLTLRPSRVPLPTTGRELMPGEAAPRFVGKGLGGEPVDLTAEKGKWKYVLLHFWETDEKCLERFLELRRVAARYKGDGLRIIGVSLDENRETALRSIRGAGLEYPHVFDGGGRKSPVAEQYHAVDLPPHFRLPKGIILSRNLLVVDTWCMERAGQLEQRLVKLLGSGDPAVPVPDPKASTPTTPPPPPLPVVNVIPADVSKLTHLALNNKNNIGDAQMERLKDASQLEWLELYGTSVTDKGLKHLAGLSKLQTLLLGQTGITDAGLVHLAGLKGLKNLHIQKNPGITDRGLEQLKGLSELEAINLFGTSVTDRGLAQLHGLKKLRHVNILATQTTSEGIAAAKRALPSCRFGGGDGLPPEWMPSSGRPRIFGGPPLATKFTIHVPGDGKDVTSVLEKAKVKFTTRKEGERTVFEVDNTGIEHLAGRKDVVAIWFPGATAQSMQYLKDMGNLELVDVLNSGIGDAGVAHLQGLTRLRTLILWGTGVSNQGLSRLKGLPDLETLDLLGARVTDSGLEHLRPFKKLKTLNLDNTQVTDAGLKVVAELTQLESLKIRNMKVTDEGIPSLQPLQKLVSLDIENNPITDNGLPALAKLQSLRVLRLGATKVTDEGLEHLKGLKNLQELHMRYSGITNDGLEHLKGLPSLRVLNLALSHVDDDGTQRLAEIAGLETLYLGGTRVTDAGLPAFAKMSRLRVLSLNKGTVSDAAIAKLKQALPNCDVKAYQESAKPPRVLKDPKPKLNDRP